jgi:hypothetical protein
MDYPVDRKYIKVKKIDLVDFHVTNIEDKLGLKEYKIL